MSIFEQYRDSAPDGMLQGGTEIFSTPGEVLLKITGMVNRFAVVKVRPDPDSDELIVALELELLVPGPDGGKRVVGTGSMLMGSDQATRLAESLLLEPDQKEG